MIEMHISHIPAQGTSDPWEVATAVVDGRKFVARSQSFSCEVKLARMLVAAGVPDQSWQSYTATGTASLRGRSLVRLAGVAIKAEKQAVQLGGGDPATPDDVNPWISAPAGWASQST
jgi:hypothetical protein